MLDRPDIPPEVLAPPEAEPIVQALALPEDDGAVLHAPLVGFRIDSVPLAGWAMALVADARHTINSAQAVAAGWRIAIDRWEHDATSVPARTIDFMEPHLERFALEQREASVDRRGEAKTKTVILPNGVIRTRSGSPVIAVSDEAAFIEWADANLPDAVKITKRPLVSELAKVTVVNAEAGAVYGKVILASTGEVVPGVVAEMPTVTAKVVIS